MILGIIIGLVLFPILAFLMVNIMFMSAVAIGKRGIGGETPQGKLVSEGQRWSLKNKISEDLPPGVYLIKTWMGDRIFMPREDGARYIPQGCAAIYPTDILDNESFELIEEATK